MEQQNLELERSLIQKAVRRGNVELVEKVFNYLFNNGNIKWLRDRLTVIAYEECWMYGVKLNDNLKSHELLEHYKELAITIKNKNVAGLATLGYKLSGGDWSAIVGNAKQREAIKAVSEAIKNPNMFWEWTKNNKVGYSKNKTRIEAAKSAIKKCKFKHDETMMYATAYFAVKDEVPQLQKTDANNDEYFPYWVVIDKHTSIGKEVLFEADDKYSVRAGRLAFYFEGSLCNQVTSSPFWDLAKKWEIERMGYTFSQAHSRWSNLRPKIIELAEMDAKELKKRVNAVIEKDSGDQMRLL